MSAPDCSGRLESEVMCPHILAGPELSRCLQESFCSSLCCIFTLPKQGETGIKKGENSFPAGRPTDTAGPSTEASLVVIWYKKSF
jgi:hypothetical protein